MLQSDKLPFSNVVILYENVLIDVFYIADGYSAGTLQMRIDKEGTTTANLTWTMKLEGEDDE